MSPAPSPAPSPDPYAPTAAAYELSAAAYLPAQAAVLDAELHCFRPSAGPVLDVGCGAGHSAAHLLQALPGAELLCLEPSPAMRSLAVSRLAAEPAWRHRVTVRPEGALDAPLPDVLGGAVMLGVLGHLDPGQRARLLRRLAHRLPSGGGAVLDLQAPRTPCVVAPFVFADARLGRLRYTGAAQGEPAGGEAMRWTMTYRVYDGEYLLEERRSEQLFHHPAPDVLDRQARREGMALRPAAREGFWVVVQRR